MISPKSAAVASLFLLVFLAATVATEAQELESGFRTPPHSTGIRCFWWWLNSNVTKEAITRDLEEMKAKGFSGALIFDADGSSQRGNQRVPAGPVFGGPEWTQLFVHACKEAKRLDLELSLNIQSGWNLGGPKVTAEESTQRLVWTETKLSGPKSLDEILTAPKGRHGFYRDVAVIAVPMPGPQAAAGTGAAKISCTLQASSEQGEHAPGHAMDGNPASFWVSEKGPTSDHPQWLLLKLSRPMELSEVSLQGRKAYGPRKCAVQLSTDNKEFRTVKEVSLKDGERVTVRFEPQKAIAIRISITDAYDTKPVNGRARNVQITEIVLPGITMAAGSKFRPIKDLPLKSSTRELGMSAPDCRFLLRTAPPMPGEAIVRSTDIVNISDKMDRDGRLRWEVPKGEWVIMRFGHTSIGGHVSTHSAGWGGRVLDYMNPDSLRTYWKRIIEPLFEAIGPLAGSSLRYVHTDSWEGGGMNWTPGFDRTFKENRGYDPLPWLAVLAGYVVDSREDSNAFLADFRKTIGDRVADHYGLLAELARKHGMATHPECSGPHAGPLDGLKNYGRSELMMSEFWSPSPHRPKPPNRFFVKQAASAAHTYGKRLAGAEGFTTIGPHWNDVPWSAMKPSFDHEFCEGLNLLFVHTFTCSPKEMGIPGQEYFAGTHFNPQITWWDEAPAVIDYFKRCQYLAQRGDFVADVAYYYGDHIPNIARRKADDPAGALPGFDYDVLSEELLLSSLTVKDGILSLPSGMKYRLLVLPDHRVLSPGALKKVDELVRAGATVLGLKPLRAVSLEGGEAGKATFKKLADGLWGPESEADKDTRKVDKGRVAWGMTAREFLLSHGVAQDVAFEKETSDAGMTWIHYRIADADVYFLSEQTGKGIADTAVFRCEGRIPELWDAVDGSMREAKQFKFADGCTHVPLAFGPYGSIFVVFRKPAAGDRNNGSNFPVWRDVQTLTAPWEVTFDAKWGGPKQPVRFAALSSWTNHENHGIKFYSGKAVYRTKFNMKDTDVAGRSFAIELGNVLDVGIARVKLNGKDLGVVWRPPFRIKTTEALKTGENVLEVDVVNSWRNRLVGDRDLPAGKRLTRTNIKIHKGWKLIESGLLGPVKIVEQQE